MKQQLARRATFLAFLGSNLTSKNLVTCVLILFALSLWWFGRQRETEGDSALPGPASFPVVAAPAHSAPPLAAPVAPPRSVSQSLKVSASAIQWMRENVRVAILSSHRGGYLKDKLHWMLNTWLKDLWDIVNVISDSEDDTDGLGRRLPGYINAVNATGCDTSMERGLWCKNSAYLKEWQSRFTDKKWFLRIMDDTYIVVENLVDFLKDLDPDKPFVFGEKWCYHTYAYPTGGPGILMSRNVIRTFDWQRWQQVPVQVVRTYLDDLAWGGYLKESGIELTHHPGFFQVFGVDTEVYQYMAHTSTWELPFKPISWHVHRFAGMHDHYMEDVHRDMLAQNFTLASAPIEVPQCICPPNMHTRCVVKPEYGASEASGCRWGAIHLKCYLNPPLPIWSSHVSPSSNNNS